MNKTIKTNNLNVIPKPKRILSKLLGVTRQHSHSAFGSHKNKINPITRNEKNEVSMNNDGGLDQSSLNNSQNHFENQLE